MTSPLDWSRIEELFHAVRDLSPGEREHVLDTECAQDAALREEIESLVRFHSQETDGLADAVLEAGHAWEQATDTAILGHAVGGWRLARLIETGGMSAVYEARREADGAIGALKRILPGLMGDKSRMRFDRERDALASLDHPHIARLLDGGAAADGTPFIVMEYVEGQPIDAFCTQRGLAVTERLELFRKVCGAVHYAHEALVVHRDIKPSNILVDAAGEPRLLDFGIAKMLEGDDMIAAASSVLTPAYASPEQFERRELGVATDVYSLGVVLCELLTERRPFESPPGAPHALGRMVCLDAPRRPSELVDDEALRNRLTDRLDAIVLRALAKDPAKRHATVMDFATEVGRCIDGEPRPLATEHRVRRRAVTIAVASAATVAGIWLAWRPTRAAPSPRATIELLETQAAAHAERHAYDDAAGQRKRAIDLRVQHGWAAADELARAYVALARDYERGGRWREALDALERAGASAPPEPTLFAALEHARARVAAAACENELARASFARAAQALTGDSLLQLATDHALFLGGTGANREARDMLSAALAAHGSAPARSIARARQVLGVLTWQSPDFAYAGALLERARTTLADAGVPPTDHAYAWLELDLGYVNAFGEDAGDARRSAIRAADELLATDAHAARTAEVRLRTARVLTAPRPTAQALGHAQAARRFYASRLGDEHPLTLEARGLEMASAADIAGTTSLADLARATEAMAAQWIGEPWKAHYQRALYGHALAQHADGEQGGRVLDAAHVGLANELGAQHPVTLRVAKWRP
ncbi:MAG: protein kinase [bacterium]|nr:protein kinase [bacterium]